MSTGELMAIKEVGAFAYTCVIVGQGGGCVSACMWAQGASVVCVFVHMCVCMHVCVRRGGGWGACAGVLFLFFSS